MTIDPLHYARRWKTLGVLSLSLVIIGLDNTILNVALPTLQDEFDASPSKLQWMVDSVPARLRRPAARLRHARRPLRAQARAPGGRVDLRPRQPRRPRRRLGQRGDRRASGDGRGRALIMPATLSIIANLFTGEERGKAIAIWAALAAVGIGLGPLAGGLLLEWFDWSSVFMVNVPFAVRRCCSASATCPRAAIPSPARSTCSGAALSTAGFSILVYAIIEAPEQGWDVRPRARLARGERRAAGRVRLVGASHRGADARPRLLPQRPLQRRHGGGQRRLLRPARRRSSR